MTRILAIDTATSATVAALSDGAQLSLASGQRHGAQLLGLLDELFGDPAGPSLVDLRGIIVGTGPGSFTGLRIGLATAKTIAYARHLPIIGVPTAAALARAAVDGAAVDRADRLGESVGAGGRIAVLQPAGPSDRYLSLVRIDLPAGDADLVEPPRILPPAEAREAASDPALVAVDLDTDENIPADARARGRAAIAGLPGSLLALGSSRSARGLVDDVAELVPTYVTLPRGVVASAAPIEWSPDLR